jgi:excisionase family DNA binding protein
MDELITSKQVQELLHVDRITVYRMVKDGRLPAVKVGRQWRFPRQEIQEVIQGGTRAKDEVRPGYAPEEVLPVHCIQVIQEVFAEMNEVASVVTDVEGEPITEISNSCEFCNLILASPSGRAACVAAWRSLAQTPKGDPQFVQCHAGFQYARGRIELSGELTAFQVAGQFLLQPPAAEETAARIEKISQAYQIPADKLIEAADSIRVLDKTRQGKIANWLKKVAMTFQIIAHERAELLDRLKNIADLSTFNI